MTNPDLDLLKAAGRHDLAGIQEALARGADVNFIDPLEKGATALLHAVFPQGAPAVVRLLLENGADPNARSRAGTVIGLAARTGDLEVVRLLAEAGADPGAKGTEGEGDAFEWAEVEGHRHVLSYLETLRPTQKGEGDAARRAMFPCASCGTPIDVRHVNSGDVKVFRMPGERIVCETCHGVHVNPDGTLKKTAGYLLIIAALGGAVFMKSLHEDVLDKQVPGGILLVAAAIVLVAGIKLSDIKFSEVFGESDAQLQGSEGPTPIAEQRHLEEPRDLSAASQEQNEKQRELKVRLLAAKREREAAQAVREEMEAEAVLAARRSESDAATISYDGGSPELFFERMSRDLTGKHGQLVRIECVSHFPHFEIWFRYQDGFGIYSGDRTGKFDIHFLRFGYVGEGPRYMQRFLDAAGLQLTSEETAALKAGMMIVRDGGRAVIRSQDWTHPPVA